jgi:AraC-like DNA-binding protein
MRKQDGNTVLGAVSRGVAAAAARSAEPGTIAMCFVAAALQSVSGRNLNADELLANVGLSPSLLQVPQARVSAKHYGALWRTIALALDDEFFGQDSRRMKAGSFAMLCHSVLSCKTLGQALDRSLRFYALILDDISGTLMRDAKEAGIILHERVAGASQRVFAHELLLMLLYGVSCWLVGRRIPILRAEFSYAEPAHSAEYRLMYCADLSFNRPNTVIAFEASYLDLPVVQNERSVKEFLRTAPESILLKYKNGSSLTARIRRRLRQFLPGEVPDFEGLAEELNMAPATMRRRLHEEGESYQSIKDHLRRDLAISYLSHSSRSVMDIALELGFSERSAFHRAFRKWTGASPGEFRRTLQT